MRPIPRSVARAAACAALLLAAASCDRGGGLQPGTTAPTAPRTADGPRPSVLLVTLDTTRADRVGAYGAPFGATPTLDGLAARGVRFEHAYTSAPLTIPAHATLFTGLLPPHHGVRDNGDQFLGPGAVTLAERFKEAGYATMASVGAYVTTRRWGFGQGFDAYFDDLKTRNRAGGSEWDLERPGDAVADDAIGWLDRQVAAPFFAWIHLFDPHHPYRPPEAWAQRYEGRPYVGEIAFADHQVGRILGVLERKGVLDDTLVAVIGDHGEGLGEHGEPLHGMLLYDSTTRVPFVVRPPKGLAAPRVVAEPVSAADLMPTLLGAAGLPVPAGLDGRDLSGTLGADEPPMLADAPVYVESEYARRHYAWAAQRKVVASGWKLHAVEKPELYPLGDHGEKDNRATAEPARVAELEGALKGLEDRMAKAREGVSERMDTSGELGERLAALGYVSASVVVAEGAHLPDPRQNLPLLGRLQGAQVAMREGRNAEAIRTLDEVLALAPELLDPRSALAQAYMRLGEFEKALPVLDEGVRRARGVGTDNANLHVLRGLVLARLGRKPQAAEAFEVAVRLDPRQPLAWGHRVELMAETGDMAKAKALCHEALAAGADSAQVRGVLGAALVMEGQVEEGERLLTRALELRPDLQWAHFHLGNVALQRNDPEKAEEHFLEESRLYPEQQRARLALSSLYARSKQYDKQLEQLAVLVEAAPKDPDLWFARAQAEFNLMRWDDAGRTLDRCLSLDADHPNCHMLRANVRAKKGDRAGAQKEADLAKELAKERGGTGRMR